MDAVGQFRCPRHYFGHGARTIELHVFVDVSQSAFAAVDAHQAHAALEVHPLFGPTRVG